MNLRFQAKQMMTIIKLKMMMPMELKNQKSRITLKKAMVKKEAHQPLLMMEKKMAEILGMPRKDPHKRAEILIEESHPKLMIASDDVAPE